MGTSARKRVTIDLMVIAALITKNSLYITPKKLSQQLGVSPRTAGKILAALEREGYVEKWSRKTYKVKRVVEQFRAP